MSYVVQKVYSIHTSKLLHRSSFKQGGIKVNRNQLRKLIHVFIAVAVQIDVSRDIQGKCKGLLIFEKQLRRSGFGWKIVQVIIEIVVAVNQNSRVEGRDDFREVILREIGEIEVNRPGHMLGCVH